MAVTATDFSSAAWAPPAMAEIARASAPRGAQDKCFIRVSPTCLWLFLFAQQKAAQDGRGASRQSLLQPPCTPWRLDDPVFTYRDRKSTRLNSSHTVISYAVFCLKKKKKEHSNATLSSF